MIPHTPLRWYGVLIALAVVIGLTISTRLARWRGLDPLLISDLLPVLAIAAVVAARIYYVAFEWERYHGAWTPLFGIIPIPRAFAVWEGGIAIHGAMVGGLLAVWVFSRLRRQPFWDLLDVLAPSLALGQAIGRWGNFFNSEAFGLPVPADFPVSVRIPPSLVDPQVLLSSPGASHFHALQSIFDPEHLQYTYLELLEAGEQMAGLLEITPTQQKHLEEMTRGQSKSKFWLRFRSGRVIAS